MMKQKLLFMMSHRLLGATLWKFIYSPALRVGVIYSNDEVFDMYTIDIHLLMLDVRIIKYN
jgi:hypothetical protein